MRISDWSSDVCSSDLDAARVEHGRADIVDQPVLDQMLAVPDRAENLPDRKRRRRMLADQAERLLILRRGRTFDPEGTIRLEILAEPRRLERGQPVVDVVEQMADRERVV